MDADTESIASTDTAAKEEVTASTAEVEEEMDTERTTSADKGENSASTAPETKDNSGDEEEEMEESDVFLTRTSDTSETEPAGELRVKSAEGSAESNLTEEKENEEEDNGDDEDDNNDDDDDSVIVVDSPNDEGDAERDHPAAGLRFSRSLQDVNTSGMKKRSSFGGFMPGAREEEVDAELHQLLDTTCQKAKIFAKPAGRRKAHATRNSMSDIYVQDLWASAGPYDSDDGEEDAAAGGGGLSGAAGGRRALPGMGGPRMGFGLPPMGAGGLVGLKASLGQRNRAPTVTGMGTARELSFKLKSRKSAKEDGTTGKTAIGGFRPKQADEDSNAGKSAFGGVRLKQTDGRPSTAPPMNNPSPSGSPLFGKVKLRSRGSTKGSGSQSAPKDIKPADSSATDSPSKLPGSPSKLSDSPSKLSDSPSKLNPFGARLRSPSLRSTPKFDNHTDSTSSSSAKDTPLFGARLRSRTDAGSMDEGKKMPDEGKKTPAEGKKVSETSPFAKFGAKTRFKFGGDGVASSRSNTELATYTSRDEPVSVEFVPKFGRPSDVKRKNSHPLTSPQPSTKKPSWSRGNNDSIKSKTTPKPALLSAGSIMQDNDVPEWKKKLKIKTTGERSNSVDQKKLPPGDTSVLEFQRVALRKTGSRKDPRK